MKSFLTRFPAESEQPALALRRRAQKSAISPRSMEQQLSLPVLSVGQGIGYNLCMGARLDQLQKMLSAQPRDPFLLYAIAMEHRKAKSFAHAVQHFRQAIEVDPGYCYAYFHLGQTLEQMRQPDAAKAAFRDGIAAAERVGDAHAREELMAALDLLV